MSKLFSPIQIGPVPLLHRVVMAPLTRSRATQPGGVPNDLMVEYYGQRASEGGLIIAEATPISPSARGCYGAPGLYTDAQGEGWKRITSAAHAKGGRIFAQLWHTGRASHVSVTEGPAPVSASVTPSYWQDPANLTSTPGGWTQPSPHHALAIAEIPGIVQITAGPPGAPLRPPSTASSRMAPTAIFRTNSCRTAATSAPTPMAGPCRTARVSCWRWSRP